MSEIVLTINHPERAEQRVALEVGRTYRIGSQSTCDIVIDLKDISRSHAALEVLGEGTFHITDLKSKNGTTVNGRRVESARFSCGDQVGVSSAVLIVVDSSETSEDSSDSGSGHTQSVVAGSSDDTEQYSRAATVEDMVTLLERVTQSGDSSSVSSILQWSVERFPLQGVILLRVSGQTISVEGNAGATSDLVSDPSVLRTIAADQHRPAEPLAVRECKAAGYDMLAASLSSTHLLILALGDGSVAFHDLRAICAALRVSLALATTSSGSSGSTAVYDPALFMELGLKDALARFEKSLLQRHLHATGWNQSEVARRLKISRTALFRKVRKYRLQSSS